MTLTKDGYIWMMIRGAKATGQSTAAFHAAVLDNPAVFENKTGDDLKNLCRELSAPASYATESKKMLALKRYRDNPPPSLDAPEVIY